MFKFVITSQHLIPVDVFLSFALLHFYFLLNGPLFVAKILFFFFEILLIFFLSRHFSRLQNMQEAFFSEDFF